MNIITVQPLLLNVNNCCVYSMICYSMGLITCQMNAFRWKLVQLVFLVMSGLTSHEKSG